MVRWLISLIIAVGSLVIIGCKENQSPKIVSLQALAGNIQPGDSVVLIAYAVDPERGRLRFRWRTNGGMLSEGNDSIAIWYAPKQRGRYKVWLRVNDALGACDRKSIKLKVTIPPGADSAFPDSIKDYEPPKGYRVIRSPRRPGGRQTP